MSADKSRRKEVALSESLCEITELGRLMMKQAAEFYELGLTLYQTGKQRQSLLETGSHSQRGKPPREAA